MVLTELLTPGPRTTNSRWLDSIPFAPKLLIKSVSDIENLVVARPNGTPLTVRHLASVQIGSDFRRGVLHKNDIDAVGGVVVTRDGADARQVIQYVKTKIASLASGFPHRFNIIPFFHHHYPLPH